MQQRCGVAICILVEMVITNQKKSVQISVPLLQRLHAVLYAGGVHILYVVLLRFWVRGGLKALVQNVIILGGV